MKSIELSFEEPPEENARTSLVTVDQVEKNHESNSEEFISVESYRGHQTMFGLDQSVHEAKIQDTAPKITVEKVDNNSPSFSVKMFDQ